MTIEQAISEAVQKAINGARPESPEELRLVAGMSVQDLAAAASVSEGTISRLERGEVENPQPDKLKAIAQGLKIPMQRYVKAVLSVRR